MIMMSIFLTGCMVDQTIQFEENKETTRIIATSFVTMQILNVLDLDIIARCETSGELPKRYEDVEIVGTAMSPDAEAIALLMPADIIGSDTLIETIKPTYDALGVDGIFIDLQSVDGLYESISILGEKYGKQDEADILIQYYHSSIEKNMSQV